MDEIIAEKVTEHQNHRTAAERLREAARAVEGALIHTQEGNVGQTELHALADAQEEISTALSGVEESLNDLCVTHDGCGFFARFHEVPDSGAMNTIGDLRVEVHTEALDQRHTFDVRLDTSGRGSASIEGILASGSYDAEDGAVDSERSQRATALAIAFDVLIESGYTADTDDPFDLLADPP
jgi:hypothetical protein